MWVPERYRFSFVLWQGLLCSPCRLRILQ
uniref:Uncharacterized protein n=1 Tax=Anguilla anguilla TaxID=7936 RepID=A0A0E9UX59_ANGAN